MRAPESCLRTKSGSISHLRPWRRDLTCDTTPLATDWNSHMEHLAVSLEQGSTTTSHKSHQDARLTSNSARRTPLCILRAWAPASLWRGRVGGDQVMGAGWERGGLDEEFH